MKKYKCQICGKEFSKITATHLKTHGTTRDEYRKRFGDEGVQGCDMDKFYKRKNPTQIEAYTRQRNQRIHERLQDHKMRQA